MTTYYKYIGINPLQTGEDTDSDKLEKWQKCDACNTRSKGSSFSAKFRKHACSSKCLALLEQPIDIKGNFFKEYEELGLAPIDINILWLSKIAKHKKGRTGFRLPETREKYVRRATLANKYIHEGIISQEAFQRATREVFGDKENGTN